MSHHFVVSILLFLRRAASIVLGHQAFPLSLAEVVSHRRVTFMYAAPLHYRLLASSPAVPCQALDRVRLAVSTAMQLPRETAEAFLSRFGIEIAEAYGIIEVGLPFINLAPRVSTRGSVGRPLPDYDLKLDHADPAGVGEVLIRGRGMFDAYFSPWQTRAECYPDGWFHTGDLGRLDAEGNLYLVGRDKTVINYAGLKVFPDEVEQVLNSHPQVCESLVYASADAQYGQVPTARVVPTGPAMAGEAFTEELRRWCFARLSAYKVPVRFELVQALRKTASGKLVRHA
jgi:long-chain acyl-CoA synthetase